MALPGRLGPIGEGRLRGGILSAARPLPAGANWRQGVAFNPVCIDTSVLRRRGCEDPEDATTKDSDPVAEPVEFNPFLVHAMTDCSTWMEPANLEQLAMMGADRIVSQTIAQQLQDNVVPGSNSPSLNSVADVITGATPQDIVNTVSALTDAMICGCAHTELVIHAPLRSFLFFKERQIIELNTSTGAWEIAPNIVMSFDCYSETGPDDLDTALDGSEIWLYATGPVEYAIGEQEVVGRPDSITVRTNEAVSLVEGLAIVRFDPCCVKAAIATIF